MLFMSGAQRNAANAAARNPETSIAAARFGDPNQKAGHSPWSQHASVNAPQDASIPSFTQPRRERASPLSSDCDGNAAEGQPSHAGSGRDVLIFRPAD